MLSVAFSHMLVLSCEIELQLYTTWLAVVLSSWKEGTKSHGCFPEGHTYWRDFYIWGHGCKYIHQSVAMGGRSWPLFCQTCGLINLSVVFISIACTAAGNMCVLVCVYPYTQILSLPFTISPSQSHTRMADSLQHSPLLCLGVHSVSASAILPGIATMATYVHETCLPPLEMNPLSTETLPPFSSPFSPSS